MCSELLGIKKQSLSNSTRLIIRERKIMIQIYTITIIGNLMTFYKTN